MIVLLQLMFVEIQEQVKEIEDKEVETKKERKKRERSKNMRISYYFEVRCQAIVLKAPIGRSQKGKVYAGMLNINNQRICIWRLLKKRCGGSKKKMIRLNTFTSMCVMKW